MFYGKIKLFNVERGFGFIRRDDHGPDAFIHVKELTRCGIEDIRPGDKVSFELVNDQRSGRLRAADVRLLEQATTRTGGAGW